MEQNMIKNKLPAYVMAIGAACLVFSAIIVITMVLLADPFSLKSQGIFSDSLALIGVSLAIWLSVFTFKKLT
jgi:hypothetical protein